MEGVCEKAGKSEPKEFVCLVGYFIIDSSIRKRLHFDMSKERKENRVFRSSKHKKSIFLQAAYTIQKIESIHQNDEKRRDSGLKKKTGTRGKIMFTESSYCELDSPRKTVESKQPQPTRYDYSSKQGGDDFQQRLKRRQQEELSKLNARIQELKKRILPTRMEDGERLESKLKEIIDIHNSDSKKEPKIRPYYSLHSSPSSKPKYQLPHENDYRQIQSDFWDKLSKETKLSKFTMKRIRSNKIDLLLKSVDSEQEKRALQKLKPALHRRTDTTQSSAKSIHSSSLINKPEERIDRNRYASPLTFSYLGQRGKSAKNFNAQKASELEEWELIRFLKQKEKRKNFISSISKQRIQNEKAIKIYSLVKGGYPLDESEVQGQFISLARFNAARSEFATLNWMYKTVQEDVNSRSKKNEPMAFKENLNHSFKRLVQINEMSTKLPPSYLQKLMKTSKIVT